MRAIRKADDRQGYLHLAPGQLRMGNLSAGQGDGIRIQKHDLLQLVGIEGAEVLLFDLPLC